MLMGEVVERDDGTPMVVSTERQPKSRKGPRPKKDSLPIPVDDEIIIQKRSQAESHKRSQTVLPQGYGRPTQTQTETTPTQSPEDNGPTP
jgi:hypothetical protein